MRSRFLAPSTFKAFDKPPTFIEGNGLYLWDRTGVEYMDLFGQNMTISLGHAHPKVMTAVKDQLDLLPHCSSVFEHPAASELADELVSTLPQHPSGEEWRVHLTVTGSEAVDLALQMALTHTKSKIGDIKSLRGCYHGLQGLARHVTHVTRSFDKNFQELLDPSGRSLSFDETFPISIFEPIQGYGGVNKLNQYFVSYLRQSSQVLICDEIQTGVGRTGHGMWGFEMFGRRNIPDIITIAKGLSNGMGLISAVVAKESISQTFSQSPFFNTYSSNPVACVAATEVLKTIKSENLVDHCQHCGYEFKNRIVDLPVRGEGLMLGLEMNNQTQAQKLQMALKDKFRIIVGRGGEGGNIIRIQPPFLITSDELTYVTDSINEVKSRLLE